MPKRIMIQCRSNVRKDAIRRESINGVEHIIVSSMTMPDDIVMNRGLYPAEEISKSFHTLERTLAPVEHPSDNNGQFLSASDPEAIHNFHAGAFNMNVEKEGNRIKVDKYINVQEAQKTDRGRRLLDRINELETSNDPRPIHTSTGIFLEVEPMGEAKKNNDDLEYDWIARNMVFDHDAILLDSVGAAQPHQGVGMAVNDDNEYEVQSFQMNEQESENEQENNTIKTRDSRTNQDGVSLSELHEKVFEALQGIGLDVMYIEELFDSEVIFQAREELFTVPYRIDNDMVTIVGIPVPVERVVSFNPKQNTKGEAMRDEIINALKAKGIKVNEELTDGELLAMYNEHLQPNQDAGNTDENGMGDQIAQAVENALKPVADKLESLEGTINAQAEIDLDKYADVVANSGLYPDLDVDSAKLLGLEKLKAMAANCGSSFGLNPVFNSSQQDDKFDLSSMSMPK